MIETESEEVKTEGRFYVFSLMEALPRLFTGLNQLLHCFEVVYSSIAIFYAHLSIETKLQVAYIATRPSYMLNASRRHQYLSLAGNVLLRTFPLGPFCLGILSSAGARELACPGLLALVLSLPSHKETIPSRSVLGAPEALC